MRIVLVHFNRKLIGLSISVRNIQNPDKTDPNYARLTVLCLTPLIVVSDEK